jgi:pre-mRNA-processing factor SLU7|tara:strand:- start:3830 stop:4969 length:1140 start_codon:yes stop_codon:yes gene_type:complete
MKVTKRVSTAGGGASMTVRNLRIREDTAKYLRNLDLGSAYYDPKTRSMRENPTPNGNPSDDFVAASGGGGGGGSHISVFLGDNVNRGTGDAVGFERLMGHASDAFDAGAEVHANANPSAAELMYKQFREKKKAATIHTKGSILDKYGDASEQTKAPEGLLLGQTETYTEYDQAGRALRGGEVVAQKSRYDEDVFDGNHTSVWGSFWHRGLWGYACCRSVQKGAYCTGSKGIAASLAANDLMLQNLETRRAAKEKEAEETAALEAAGAGTSFGKSGMKNPFGEGASKWGDKDETAQDVELDPAKLMEALRKEDKRLKGDDADADDEISDKKKRGNKRGYNVLADEKEPTEEEMEAFRMKRTREEDPMAAKDAGTGGYDLV